MMFAIKDNTNNNKVSLYPKTTIKTEKIKGVYTPNTENQIICLKNAIIKVPKTATSTIPNICKFIQYSISLFTK
jgi:hypothetical protein